MRIGFGRKNWRTGLTSAPESQGAAIISNYESDSASLQLQQHLSIHDLIPNPNAIRGSPKKPRQPQHVLQATGVHLENMAKLNNNDPTTKQIISHNPYK